MDMLNNRALMHKYHEKLGLSDEKPQWAQHRDRQMPGFGADHVLGHFRRSMVSRRRESVMSLNTGEAAPAWGSLVQEGCYKISEGPRDSYQAVRGLIYTVTLRRWASSVWQRGGKGAI